MLAITRKHQEKEKQQLVLPEGVDHLSFSAIETYLTCPMRYYFRYIEGVKTPPVAALEFGSMGHEALEMNNIHKFEQGIDLPKKLVQEKFSDEFTKVAPTIEDWGDDDANKLIKTGNALLSNYMDQAAPELTPVEKPEERKTIKLFGIDFVYVIDLKTSEGIYDYKFVGKNKTVNDVKNSPQMWLYSLAEKTTEVGMISLNKKTQEVSMAPATIDEQDKRWMKEIAYGATKGICAGIFFPRKPDGLEAWQCSKKFCGYYGICRGKA